MASGPAGGRSSARARSSSARPTSLRATASDVRTDAACVSLRVRSIRGDVPASTCARAISSRANAVTESCSLARTRSSALASRNHAAPAVAAASSPARSASRPAAIAESLMVRKRSTVARSKTSWFTASLPRNTVNGSVTAGTPGNESPNSRRLSVWRFTEPEASTSGRRSARRWPARSSTVFAESLASAACTPLDLPRAIASASVMARGAGATGVWATRGVAPSRNSESSRIILILSSSGPARPGVKRPGAPGRRRGRTTRRDRAPRRVRAHWCPVRRTESGSG